MTVRIAIALVWLLLAVAAAGATPVLDGTGEAVTRPAVGLGGGSLLGTVRGPAGDPLSGVCVAAQANGGVYRTTTNERGAWSLTDLPAGAAFLSFNDCEHPIAGRAVAWWESHLVVREAVVLDGIDVTLRPAAEVSGRVIDAQGRPADETCVTALDDEGGPVGRTRTDTQGRYELAALPAGDVTLEALDCSGTPTRTASTVQITTQEGSASTAADLHLGVGGAITGLVTAAHTGEPAPGACVTLWTAEAEVAASRYRGARTVGEAPRGHPLADPGRYAFDGVEPGRYRVLFGFDSCSPEDGFSEEWFDDLHGPAMYEPDATTEIIEVPTGESISGVDAELIAVAGTSVICPWPPDPGFADVHAEDTHHQGIACVTAFGLASGRPDGGFAASHFVTRSQLATLLTRAMAVIGTPLLPDPEDAFDDDDGNLHETAINQLAALDVLQGAGLRRVDPNAAVTRAQLASVLVRAYRASTGTDVVRGPDRWVDDDGSVHESALDAAALAGLLAGTTETEVSPSRPVTRAQLATSVARFMDRVIRDTPVRSGSR